MSRPIVTFSSVLDAEDRRQGRDANQVAFKAHEQISLRNAAEIKSITRAGVHGFEVVNPELIDCKNRTKLMLEEVYEQMFEDCMTQCNQEILIIDGHIASLKLKINRPNDQIPHMGPAVNVRNQGIQEVMYLPSVYGEFPSYEYGSIIPYRAPLSVDTDIAAAIDRDKLSQKAWWKANLTFLETKKKVLEEKKIDLGRKLRADMMTAIHSQSYLGSGYLDYSFLHT